MCRYPGSAQVATIQAAVLARTSNAAEADAALRSLKVEDAELQLQIGLIRAQLAAVSGKPGEVSHTAQLICNLGIILCSMFLPTIGN